MTAPTFEIIGDGRLSDEAIEALATLLLSVVEAEKMPTAQDEDQHEELAKPGRCA